MSGRRRPWSVLAPAGQGAEPCGPGRWAPAGPGAEPLRARAL